MKAAHRHVVEVTTCAQEGEGAGAFFDAAIENHMTNPFANVQIKSRHFRECASVTNYQNDVS
jgi:hypothetical protein